ncbi:cache domain-containing protein [Enterobacter hormaechei]
MDSPTSTWVMPAKRLNFPDPTGVPADHDPTLRPWYQQAVSADGPVATAPYVDAGTGKLVVTFAVPVKSKAPESSGGGRCGDGQRGG